MANRPPVPMRLRSLHIFVLTVLSLVTFAALALPLSLRPAALPLQAGDVAPIDLQAPRDHEYVSQVRTEEARQAVENAILPVYTPPDPAIARQQIDKLASALDFMTIVRADESANADQKLAQL